MNVGESREEYAARLGKYKGAGKWWDLNDFKAFLFSVPGSRAKADFAPSFHRLLAEAYQLSQNNELNKLDRYIVDNFLHTQNGLIFGLFTQDDVS